MAHLRIFGRKSSDDQPTSTRPRVLFVSHEATRTGAPKIILNIVKRAFQTCDIDCETIIHDEGHLTEEFNSYSNVQCLHLPRLRSAELQKRVKSIVRRRRSTHPVVAVCNSMESRFVSEQLCDLGIPVISLLHELPCSYSENDYRLVYEKSSKVVFPVQIVREATHKKLPIPFGKDLIMPQGLLNPHFGNSISREGARQQLRNELSLPQDAFVVLGCGTLDMRKGIDHFAAVAKSVVRRNNYADSIHFVWVGDGPRWPHSTFHYVQIDLRHSKVAAHVHFVGEREHVDSYFKGADMFFLSSRVDPFPCVIHEAMATELPVLAFTESGGANEALSDGAGFLVQYADYEMATHLIMSQFQNPGLARGVTQNALQRVRNEYSFDKYADNIISLAENLAGRKFARRYDHSSIAIQRAA